MKRPCYPWQRETRASTVVASPTDTAIDRLVARREVPLREKTLHRMLYETAGRAEESLGLDIEDLDLAGRR